MNTLPGALGGTELVVWRLDQKKHATTWDTGEGAFLGGGRWNHRGVRAVYCAIDPATAILEVAAHKTFKTLDTIPHVLTSAIITDLSDIKIVKADDLPNPNWLVPGLPSAGQQLFGSDLLGRHPMIMVPSVVSKHSWNLIFTVPAAGGRYTQRSQEDFALDPRLHPPV